MEDNSTKGLKRERKRRQRISRIRNGIIGIFGIWLIASAYLCITLTLRVHSLEDKLEYLLD
ncbi:MAG: polysaccharide deacetylase, partial [Lachnospiraceae bacterium]|nr:polysaccharide deacetylase [Lachnospiraceae bacterium]